MSTIPLQIVFHGLVALVPVGGSVTDHMTALLVDAHQIPAEATAGEKLCFVPHTPLVTFPAEGPGCTDVDECDLESGGLCTCKLEGGLAHYEIELQPDVHATPTTLLEKPLRTLPFDRIEAAKVSYVANLKQLGARLDPAFLSPTEPLPAALAPRLAARFTFPFKSLTSCDLSTRRDDGIDYVHPLNFRRLGDPEVAEEISQALAQQVVATAMDIDNAEPNEHLKLVLKPLPGNPGDTHEFKINVASGAERVVIKVTNSRHQPKSNEQVTKPDPICDDGIGRDFAFLYNLAVNPPAWGERLVPHVKYSLSKPFTDLAPGGCEATKDPLSRPICPLGSYNPP